MSPDHAQETIFVHWSDGKPPANNSGSTKIANHKCGVPDCDKAYARYSDLYRHLLSHNSGPRTHSCLADRCPRKGLNGFWRLDKSKEHMQRKHPEIEIERWHYGGLWGGYRDVEKREEHEALMLSKGYRPHHDNTRWFVEMSPSEMAAI